MSPWSELANRVLFSFLVFFFHVLLRLPCSHVILRTLAPKVAPLSGRPLRRCDSWVAISGFGLVVFQGVSKLLVGKPSLLSGNPRAC